MKEQPADEGVQRPGVFADEAPAPATPGPYRLVLTFVDGERRAEWVCDYLKEKRVRPEQLVSTGYGELRPLFDESRPGGKARNRRVELVLLSPHGELPLLEGME